ncbi:MAG: CPBP family intramembrane glutamic endopeptidase [Candidatus Sulfotelmatobacter sp.]
MSVVLSHLLAAYAVVLAPWLSCVFYQRARKRIAAGVPNAKLKLFRSIVAEQVVTTALPLAIWREGRISAAALGLIAPRSLVLTTAVLAVILGLLVWSSLKLRPKAEKVRAKLDDKIGALLPDSLPERRWFAAVSVGAGISEELVFRGFLIYYFGVYIPQLNPLEKVLLASLFFGLGHLYQGRTAIVSTGLMGLALAGLYLMTGSLLLPVLVHAALDARALLIFPPPPDEASAALAVGSSA